MRAIAGTILWKALSMTALSVVLLCATMGSGLSAAPGGRFRKGPDDPEGGRAGRRREAGGGAFARFFKDAPPACRPELRKLLQELRQKQQALRQEYEQKAEAMLAECKKNSPSPAPGASPDAGAPAPGASPDAGAPADGDDDGQAPAAASPAPAPSAEDGHK